MKIDRSITLFLNYCRSKQLRSKTLQSYEQALGLFAKWLRENEQIEEVEDISKGEQQSIIFLRNSLAPFP